MTTTATDPVQNGTGPAPSALWESGLLQSVLENVLARIFRSLSFSVTLSGVTLAVAVSPTGTAIAISFTNPEPECQFPDPEPSTDQSTDTATPA